MPKKPTASIQRTGNYARNLKNVKATRDSIIKARDSVSVVKGALLTNLDETVVKITELKKDKYDPYSSELSAAQADLKTAMRSQNDKDIVTSAVFIVNCIKKQIDNEKKNVGELNKLLERAENIILDCRNFEDQCLALIKKATAISLSINPQKTSFILSRSTFDKNEFIPTDQLESIDLDLSILADKPEYQPPESGMDDNGEIREVPRSQEPNENTESGRFKMSFEKSKVKRLNELKTALQKEGRKALTPQRTEVAIALYEKCIRVIQAYHDSCVTWSTRLTEKRPEIQNFFKSVDEQLVSAMEPLEYKHRIVTV